MKLSISFIIKLQFYISLQIIYKIIIVVKHLFWVTMDVNNNLIKFSNYQKQESGSQKMEFLFKFNGCPHRFNITFYFVAQKLKYAQEIILLLSGLHC